LQEECKGKEAASEEIDAVLEVQNSGVLPQLVSAGTGHNDNRSTSTTAVKSKPIDYHAIMLKESPRDVVRKRLQWMVDHAAEGQMPVGEAICGVTGNFVPSSTPNIYEYAGVYIWVRASSLLHRTLCVSSRSSPLRQWHQQAVLMEQGMCWLPNPKRWTVQ
jgi:hypothetical protein